MAAIMIQPREVPAELFDLSYTVSEGAEIIFAVYACRMCKSLVPDSGRKHHHQYHVIMAEMIAEALGTSLREVT